MAYIYTNVSSLQNTAKVGDKNCVALVQHYLGAQGLGRARTWREGAKVLGNTTIAPGTAIATFENGRYPNRDTGNHAALYISQTGDGIWIMDQWKNDISKPRVSMRFLPKRGGVQAGGSYPYASDNAEAFSVIE